MTRGGSNRNGASLQLRRKGELARFETNPPHVVRRRNRIRNTMQQYVHVDFGNNGGIHTERNEREREKWDIIGCPVNPGPAKHFAKAACMINLYSPERFPR